MLVFGQVKMKGAISLAVVIVLTAMLSLICNDEL
jgi:hypothetical protein